MGRQSVRISQAVLTLGPGAILESREGPRIILQHGLSLPAGHSLEDLEISSPELQALLAYLLGSHSGDSGENMRIFQVPSADMISGVVWRTRPFPEWKLCVEHQILFRNRCPECSRAGSPSGGRRRGREAIRFVRACPEGHLDDVDWEFLVHGGHPSHSPSDFYRWKSTGTSLQDIRIECPRCRRGISLGQAYRQEWPCSGRYPEREPPDGSPQRPGCQRKSYILQRQASNLRIPEVFSLFIIPPPYTALHRLLEKRTLKAALVPNLVLPDGRLQRRALEEILNHQVSRRMLDRQTRDEILQHPDEEIARAIREVLEYQPPSDPDSLLQQEFRALLRGAREGIPPLHAPPPRSRILLEIDPNQVRDFPPFRVIPVRRLTVITVQIGYRREVSPLVGEGIPARLVDVSIVEGDQRWFPGYESSGEGLFIIRNDPSGEGWERGPDGEASRTWLEVWARDSYGYEGRLFRDPARRRELHPAFVAWHTLAHLLIRALEVDSGYSAPSIRERVYLENRADGQVRGGILLYTSSRSGDSSMGGLLALAPVFDRVLRRVAEMVRICSADPLCRDHRFRAGMLTGAACHGCCLISETSCEHRNFWLDRNVLLETGWL